VCSHSSLGLRKKGLAMEASMAGGGSGDRRRRVKENELRLSL
jgi:hypothetical protein